MTWTAATMPDDALPPDCLVGRMLNVKPTSSEPQIRSSEVSPELLAEATIEQAELPLWLVMEQATGSCVEWDAVIEALRDWLLPEEPEPATLRITYIADEQGPQVDPCILQRSQERQRLRAQLTEQAAIARGEQ